MNVTNEKKVKSQMSGSVYAMHMSRKFSLSFCSLIHTFCLEQCESEH